MATRKPDQNPANTRNDRVLAMLLSLHELGDLGTVIRHQPACRCDLCYWLAREITNAVEGRTDRKGGKL